jgi:hypothetical protein
VTFGEHWINPIMKAEELLAPQYELNSRSGESAHGQRGRIRIEARERWSSRMRVARPACKVKLEDRDEDEELKDADADLGG